MQFSILQSALALLLVACVASFRWAMGAFFRQPSGFTPGMQAIKLSSSLTFLLNLIAILIAPPVPMNWAVLAVLIYSASLGLFWWAIQTNRSRPLTAVFTPDAPEHLVTNGPYRFVRHPFYTSYMLAWAGGIPASGALWLLIPLAVMIGLYWKAAEVEEDKFARSSLAAEYRAYCSRTGRFLPIPWKAAQVRQSA